MESIPQLEPVLHRAALLSKPGQILPLSCGANVELPKGRKITQRRRGSQFQNGPTTSNKRGALGYLPAESRAGVLMDWHTPVHIDLDPNRAGFLQCRLFS